MLLDEASSRHPGIKEGGPFSRLPGTECIWTAQSLFSVSLAEQMEEEGASLATNEPGDMGFGP